MEFTSLDDYNRVKSLLVQIEEAIMQLKDWNADVSSADEYYRSSTGMQKLAASCMLIEARGEGIKQIDKVTKGKLLEERPEVPWVDVMGIRNHIAHGYFDIDGDVIYKSVREDLDALQEAVKYFLMTI